MPGLFQNGIMPFPLLLLLTAVFAYFCGCFNGAVIVSKYILRDDVRNHGSGNAGLTNFFRTFGGPLTLVVILCDVLKAVIALLVGQWLFRHGYTDFISAEDTTILWLTLRSIGADFSACWVMCSHVCFISRAVRAFFPAVLSLL